MGDNVYRRFNSVMWVMLCCIPVIFVVGCLSSGKTNRIVSKRIIWEQETPADFIERLRENQRKIVDLTAGYLMTIDPPPAGRPSSFRGVVSFVRKPEGPSVRIKGIGPLGRLYFDMVQQPGGMSVYIPSQRTLYRGRAGYRLSNGGTWEEMFGVMVIDFMELQLPPDSAFHF